MDRMWQGQFLNREKLVWIQFSFSETGCRSKAKEPSVLYYLPVAGGKNRWIQRISLKWNTNSLIQFGTLVANFISYNIDCYTKCASKCIDIIMIQFFYVGVVL